MTDSATGLRKAVAIPSISADEERRPDVVKVSSSHLLSDCSRDLRLTPLYHRCPNFSCPNSQHSEHMSSPDLLAYNLAKRTFIFRQ